MSRLLAVVFGGKREREVSDREEAFAWARSEGAASVDLWTAPAAPHSWQWLHPRIFDDGSKPIAFNVQVPPA